jgi:hypothetical protein
MNNLRVGFLVMLLPLLSVLSGCMQSARKTPEGQQIESTRQAALGHFVANTATIQKATLKGYQAEGYAHTTTKHAWDTEKIESQAKDLLIAQANKQDVSPAKAKIDSAEFMKFATEAKTWADKTAKEWDANRLSVDQRAAAVEQLIGQAQIDYAMAMKLEALLQQMDDSGLPPAIIQQATGLIQQILGSKAPATVPAIQPSNLNPKE